METIKVSTEIYLPPEEVFTFLIDFPGYADYSQYLEEVTQYGDGTAGTEYALRFQWWKLAYTVQSVVTNIKRPKRIDWEIQDEIDAHGHWELEATPEKAPPERTTATTVWFVATFAPSSMSWDLVDIPRLASIEWIRDRATSLVVEEAKRVVARVVTDLEGESRPIELTIHQTPSNS